MEQTTVHGILHGYSYEHSEKTKGIRFLERVQHIGAVLIWTLALIMAILVIGNQTNVGIIACRCCPEIAKGCSYPFSMLE